MEKYFSVSVKNPGRVVGGTKPGHVISSIKSLGHVISCMISFDHVTCCVISLNHVTCVLQSTYTRANMKLGSMDRKRVFSWVAGR